MPDENVFTEIELAVKLGLEDAANVSLNGQAVPLRVHRTVAATMGSAPAAGAAVHARRSGGTDARAARDAASTGVHPVTTLPLESRWVGGVMLT